MAMVVVKDGHKKDPCHDEVGACAQNAGTIQFGGPMRLYQGEFPLPIIF